MVVKRKYLIIPIVTYQGLVEILDRPQIHPLHELLLELICTEHNISKVIHSFGIDVRIVHEAIVDLMYKQMIQVDFENSKIYPVEEVKTAIDQGRLKEFLGIQFPDIKTINWAQDTKIGEIFLDEDIQYYFSKPPILYSEMYETPKFNGTKFISKSAEYQIHLNQKNFIPLPETSHQRLIKIAKMKLRQYISEGSIYDRVSNIKKIQPISNATLYIPLTSQKIQGKEIFIPQSDIIPSDVLESWIGSISDLNPYTISDLTSLSDDFLFNYDWIRLIDQLSVLLSKLGDIYLNKNGIKNKIETTIHFIETTINNKILPYLKDLIIYTDNFDYGFSKGLNLFNRLKNDLEKAKDIVIFGSPFIQEDIFNKLKPIIDNLLAKDVKIIILWGGLGDKPLNLIKSPVFEQKNLYFIESISNFHSKFLIIDDCIGWITSCNLLSYGYTQNNPMEDYCIFSNKALMLELYEYSIQRIENESIIKMINAYLQNIPFALKESNIIPEIEDSIDNLVGLLELMTNKKQIKSNLEKINDSKSLLKNQFRTLRNLKTGVLIQNLDHRKLLRVIFQEARRNIHIGTDRIIENAISPVILSAFNESLDRSVKINIKWGREKDLSRKTHEIMRLESSVDFLNKNTKYRLNLSNKPSHSHAKYLLMDNRLLLITSYNLLAFSGNGLSDEEITDELGLVISGKSIKDKL